MDILADSEREERLSRQLLTTAECARALGMTPAFIRGEIEDKRLKAHVFKPEGRRRATYQIRPEDFAAYVQRHWPTNDCST